MNVGHLDKLRVTKLKKFAAIFQDVKLHWTSFNPSATRSDQWVISPHNVNILSRRDVMRTKISISQRISFDGTLNSQREDYDKCMSYSEEKWQLNLGVREFVKITDCRWLMLRNRFGTRLCQQIENQSWKPRSYLRSSIKLAWSGASDRESHKFVNINSAVANKKPCKTSMNISNLEETHIPLLLQQSKRQIISYRAVCLNSNKPASRNVLERNWYSISVTKEQKANYFLSCSMFELQ